MYKFVVGDEKRQRDEKCVTCFFCTVCVVCTWVAGGPFTGRAAAVRRGGLGFEEEAVSICIEFLLGIERDVGT